MKTKTGFGLDRKILGSFIVRLRQVIDRLVVCPIAGHHFRATDHMRCGITRRGTCSRSSTRAKRPKIPLSACASSDVTALMGTSLKF